jgi:hypothetical protein
LQAWAHQEALIGTEESRTHARKLYQKCDELDSNSVHSWQVRFNTFLSLLLPLI